ncbi:mitochondria-eating protein isoform X6 [Pelodiscus sinensis]|uniref:mitochondria-eating protein isoform X6 n=1 Tax=Pelodiscus sinensis TaxID=13735 RepID=UPI000D723F2C|nr:mitochondria-eating protein isoform X6 [Pelodiscus sinensis]|eukprot:XP_025035719.1 mitochondria-eating protein isoform X6 [Pelodiscus sinensis]
MADSLRRLISNESCRILQEKLENWYKDYHINTCDQNLNRCCEIIEMNSMIQGQLFTILNQTAREGENFPCLQGGHYAGVETIKSRLLPWLGTCFSSTTSGRPFETSLSLIQESIERERQLREFASTRNHELQHLEKELNSTRLQLSLVQQDLAEAQMALEETKTKSATTLLAAEDEIIHLNAALARSRSPSPRRCRSRSPSPLPLRSCSPGRARLTNAARHAHLVARFSEIYAQERLDAQALLMTYIEDLEMVQRIIYVAAVESFHAAKMAFRQFKMRVRKTLSLTYSGPESLEDTILDYIVRHEDLYDVQASVNEVIRAMNINPKISFPPEVDFIMISSLIRELCRVAFSMQTLVPPLDIAFGADGELFNENKYHRSYDSDFTAPLVVYHVWPPLIENDSVIVKGEAVSKRGALWSRRSRSKSRSRSRSMSPILSHSASPSRTLLPRSRSPSPIRSGSPSKWAHSVHNASWFSLSA